MQFMLQPYHMVLATLIGWANERQQQIIEFQNDQIEALLKKLGKKRLLLTDDQRRVLAVKVPPKSSMNGRAIYQWLERRLSLRQICVFDPAELVAPDQEPDSTENR